MAEQESGGGKRRKKRALLAISRIESNLVARGAISPERFSVDVLRRIIDGSQFAGTNRSNRVSADVRALRACTERLIQRAQIYRVCVLARADQDHASPIAPKITARELVSREYTG